MSPRQKAAAWRRLARQWEQATCRSRFWCEPERGATGLCESLGFGWGPDMNKVALHDDMGRTLGTLRSGLKREGYWWPITTEEGRDCRVMACCLMAAISEAGDLP